MQNQVRLYLGISIFLVGITMLIPPMEADAAQYAEMSREMALKGLSVFLFDHGLDYLDKPPLLFWISSLSIKLLGASSFAYKLPSVLISFFGLYCLYRYSRLYYDYKISLAAVLILSSTAAYYHMSNDVRTDLILMSFVIASFTFLAEWLLSGKTKHLLCAAFFIGLGLLSKGMIAVILPAASFLTYIIINKRWDLLFKKEYLLAIILIVILLLPWCYGLYQQFDLHPEKILYGKTNTSGLRFFFWTQSFGRITGESTWNNGAGWMYLPQGLLWQLLPYTFVFIGLLIHRIKEINSKEKTFIDPFSWSAILLGYLMLGSSKYQLPHYIYIIFPFIALQIAVFIYRTEIKKWFQQLHLVLIPLLFLFVLYINYQSFSLQYYDVFICLLALILMVYVFLLFYKKKMELVYFLAFSFLSIQCMLSFIFYPNLLQYQFGTKMAQEIQLLAIDKSKIYNYGEYPDHSLDFHSNFDFKRADTLLPGNFYIITESDKMKFAEQGHTFDVLFCCKNFLVSHLKAAFFNPEKRDQMLNKSYLVKLEK